METKPPILHGSKFIMVYPNCTHHTLDQWHFYAKNIAAIQRDADVKWYESQSIITQTLVKQKEAIV